MASGKIYSGSLNTIILKLLSEKEQMYGYEITRKVKALTGGKLNITEGALYPALHKLEAEGLLETKTKKVDNRLRKYYKLTKKGHGESVEKVAELEIFIQNLQAILNPKTSFG